MFLGPGRGVRDGREEVKTKSTSNDGHVFLGCGTKMRLFRMDVCSLEGVEKQTASVSCWREDGD